MIAHNRITGEARELPTPSMRTLERVMDTARDLCTGPCRHVVEPDGECFKGWPSRLSVAGYI